MKQGCRVYITGASCAGVTTLGRTLACLLGIKYLDIDDFFWLPTDLPYTIIRPPEERINLIAQELTGARWILSGSLDHWGEVLLTEADMIVFVVTPTPVRMERLAAREKARYGDRILPGGDMYETHLSFRQWASQYDVNGFSGRNRARHEAWLLQQTIPVIRLDGTKACEDLAAQIIPALECINRE